MNQDYKQLLTEVIKKQIVILGPDITLSKARNVKGLTVANDGTVTNVDGQAQEVIQALIDQFVQLSGLIVKKTMEPLLTLSQTQISVSPTPAMPATPMQSTVQQMPTTSSPGVIGTQSGQATQVSQPTPAIAPADSSQATINQALGQVSEPAQSTVSQTAPLTPNQTAPIQNVSEPVPVQPSPAKNPLAA